MIILFGVMQLGIKADAATTLRTGKIHVDAYDFYDVNFHSSGNGYIDIEYKIIHNGNDTGNYILELLDDDDNTIEKDDIEIISDSSCNELIYCPKRTTSGNFTYRFNNYSDIPFTVQYSVKLYPSLATGFSFTKSNITLDIGKSVDILINSTPSNSLFVWKDGNFTKSVKFQSEFQFARLNSGTELTHL